ncbi:MAG: DoxX family membrane protein [Desulfuromonadaceae bacterium]|nr:DoxX family membrane protein [Desulfuromonadaceae bacterium]
MKRTGQCSYHLCRLLLGAVFIYAGILKINDIPVFAGQIARYELLPYQWNYLAAATLPYIEVIAGLLLICNRRVRAASLTIGGMLIFFILILLSVLARGLEIDCGCFGPSIQSSPQQALLRNVLLLVLAHFVFHLRNTYAREKSLTEKESDS